MDAKELFPQRIILCYDEIVYLHSISKIHVFKTKSITNTVDKAKENYSKYNTHAMG